MMRGVCWHCVRACVHYACLIFKNKYIFLKNIFSVSSNLSFWYELNCSRLYFAISRRPRVFHMILLQRCPCSCWPDLSALLFVHSHRLRRFLIGIPHPLLSYKIIPPSLLQLWISSFLKLTSVFRNGFYFFNSVG